jgi:Glycosyl transferase family 11
MISCYLMGGLGNQLFQIFCTIAYSIQYKCDFIFPYSEKLTVGVERPTYWDNLLSDLHKKTTDVANSNYTNEDIFKWAQIQEKRFFEWQELPPRNFIRGIDGAILVGYFQSLKYFGEYSERIIENIGLREKQNNIREKYDAIFSAAGDRPYTIAMHFRIGDYAQKQDNHPVLPYEYYEAALYKIFEEVPPMNCVVYYFCEKENNNEVAAMVDRLNKFYENMVIFIKVDDSMPDWEQMLFMSCCNHHVIANSTFSWWGAYLCKNPARIVCYPGGWLGPKLQGYSVHEMIPKTADNAGNWICI